MLANFHGEQPTPQSKEDVDGLSGTRAFFAAIAPPIAPSPDPSPVSAQIIQKTGSDRVEDEVRAKRWCLSASPAVCLHKH